MSSYGYISYGVQLFAQVKIPELNGDYPLNLSISVSGGKEINEDCLSRGD
jgi:hypothetical protein